MKRFLEKSLALVVIITMLLWIVSPVIVLAEGETPPEPGGGNGSPSTETGAAGNAGEQPAVLSLSGEEGSAPPSPPVPITTALVILDEQGNPVPFASEYAA
jgi:hypothetical protein